MSNYVAKMVRTLELRNLSPQTLYRYSRDVERFLNFFPDTPTEKLGKDDVASFVLSLKHQHALSPSAQRHALASLRNFFKHGLERPHELANIPWPRVPKSLPDIWSDQELEALFRATPNLKYRTIFCTLYATGTRLSEACNLTVHDLDRARGLIHIRGGKGDKDRFIPLGRALLTTLEAYWRAIRPPLPYLFPGDISKKPIRNKMVEAAMTKAVARSGVQKKATPHTLRHCYATRCLEHGMDLHTLQMLLGHSSLRTTQIYLHLSTRHIANAFSPFDLLGAIAPEATEVRS